MRVHWFQHVEFEGLGLIEPWMRTRGYELSATRWWAGETVSPAVLEGCDWLVVMGGPMNVYQHRDYPWLPAEKAAIAAAVHAGKRVFGICLGAQLIADVLGGKVMQNAEREIGWWPVRAVAPLDPGAPPPASGLIPGPVRAAGSGVVQHGARCEAPNGGGAFEFPAELMVLHWHGDTFTLPPGATPLAESAACARQAFAWGPRVLALQFHLEMDAAAVTKIAQACANELEPGAVWVQAAGQIVEGARRHGAEASVLLDRLLTALARA